MYDSYNDQHADPFFAKIETLLYQNPRSLPRMWFIYQFADKRKRDDNIDRLDMELEELSRVSDRVFWVEGVKKILAYHLSWIGLESTRSCKVDEVEMVFYSLVPKDPNGPCCVIGMFIDNFPLAVGETGLNCLMKQRRT